MSTLFSGHCLRNRSTLDIGVLDYIGIVQHKEHPPDVWSFPPVTPCIYNIYIYTYIHAVGQQSSRTCHRVHAVAALDKNLSMVW